MYHFNFITTLTIKNKLKILRMNLLIIIYLETRRLLFLKFINQYFKKKNNHFSNMFFKHLSNSTRFILNRS